MKRVVNAVVDQCARRNWKGVARQLINRDSAGKLRKLGATIRFVRLERGLSQEALAAAAGIARSLMGKIERGERYVSVLNVARMSDALHVSIASLMASAGL